MKPCVRSTASSIAWGSCSPRAPVKPSMGGGPRSPPEPPEPLWACSAKEAADKNGWKDETIKGTKVMQSSTGLSARPLVLLVVWWFYWWCPDGSTGGLMVLLVVWWFYWWCDGSTGGVMLLLVVWCFYWWSDASTGGLMLLLVVSWWFHNVASITGVEDGRWKQRKGEAEREEKTRTRTRGVVQRSPTSSSMDEAPLSKAPETPTCSQAALRPTTAPVGWWPPLCGPLTRSLLCVCVCVCVRTHTQGIWCVCAVVLE